MTQTQCSHRHPLTCVAFVWGNIWTLCLPLPQEWGGHACPVHWVGWRLLVLFLQHPQTTQVRQVWPRHFPPGQTDNSKGDYFPSSAFPHVSLSVSTATPWCSDSIPLLHSSYQQACCNMDKANTCFSMGSSYCDFRVIGISLGFQLDALRLSAACCYVIS